MTAIVERLPEIISVPVTAPSREGPVIKETHEPQKEAKVRFSDLVTDSKKDVSKVIDDIVPEKLLKSNGRRAEVFSETHAVVRFGPLATLSIHTDALGPYYKNKERTGIKPRGEFVFSPEGTTHSLEGANITHPDNSTKIAFPKFTAEKHTAATSIKITPTGIEKTVSFEPSKGYKNPLYSHLTREEVPQSLTLPPEGPKGKQVEYSLEDAKISREGKRLKVVLPATDHLSSVVITTLEVTPKGVEKTVKIIPEGVVFDINQQTNQGKDALTSNISPEIQGAIKLNESRHDELKHDIEEGKVVVIAPTLRKEGEGEIKRMNRKDEVEYQQDNVGKTS